MNLAELAVAAGDQAFYRSEDIQLGEVGVDARAREEAPRPGLGEAELVGFSPCSLLLPDYKNNILKERAELAHSPLPAKHVDLDKGEWLGGTPPLPIRARPVPHSSLSLESPEPCCRMSAPRAPCDNRGAKGSHVPVPWIPEFRKEYCK